MALQLRVEPGYVFVAGQIVSIDDFNAAARPQVFLEGTISPDQFDAGTINWTVLQGDAYFFAEDDGATNAIHVTLGDQAPNAYMNGLVIAVELQNTITSNTPTLEVGSLGARRITRHGGKPLKVGDLEGGRRYEFRLMLSSDEATTPSTWELMSLPSDLVNTGYDFEAPGDMGDGRAGLVPAPKVGEREYYLRSDGWQDITSTVNALIAAAVSPSGSTVIFQHTTFY